MIEYRSRITHDRTSFAVRRSPFVILLFVILTFSLLRACS
jgi:hypothetical protein